MTIPLVILTSQNHGDFSARDILEDLSILGMQTYDNHYTFSCCVAMCSVDRFTLDIPRNIILERNVNIKDYHELLSFLQRYIQEHQLIVMEQTHSDVPVF